MLRPAWNAPANVHAYYTTRRAGQSEPPFNGLNLALHVNDNPQHVLANRQYLRTTLHLPSEPIWLEQVHGIQVVEALPENRGSQADACVAFKPRLVCAVMTADCLPVFFCDKAGSRVALAHAGWRGLAAGILEETLKALKTDPAQILVTFGAAISAHAFEVGEEVRHTFVEHASEAEKAFYPHRPQHFYADLYELARQRLQAAGVPRTQMSGGEYCTYQQSDLFFSYRREKVTGRMASLIWLEN